MKEIVSCFVCISERGLRRGILSVFVVPETDICFSKIDIKYCAFAIRFAACAFISCSLHQRLSVDQ